MRVLAVSLLFVAGCGRELATIALREPGVGEARVHLEAGQTVKLWSRMNVEWEQKWRSRYWIALVDGEGRTVAAATCSPQMVDLKVGCTTNEGSHPRYRRCFARMHDCRLKVLDAGDYTLRAELAIPVPPLAVHDMSVVVRD